MSDNLIAFTSNSHKMNLQDLSSSIYVIDLNELKSVLPGEISVFEEKALMLNIVRNFISTENLQDYDIWTDTPKAMKFIRHLNPEYITYSQSTEDFENFPELTNELIEYADEILDFKEHCSITPSRVDHEQKFNFHI